MGMGYESHEAPVNESYDSESSRAYEKLRELSYRALYHVIGNSDRAERIKAAMRRLKSRREENDLTSKMGNNGI